MSYLVLARKWRPMKFEDLVGQDHVARTLGNAIAAGRVAHAFLFTGVRGVGKTTSARILAKALNCMRKPGTVPAGEDPGPTATPCLECPACLEIAAGNDVDVREIDGASYNGVDEVRKLQDSIPYRPNRDRYKIFIIDEVHMLSQSAWNAFLKTLEEPPPHVKFIFATTEVHKIPITILSRVQRFDFKLIPARLIIERLRYVLGQEGIQAEDGALSVIAREAAGSMRDAMSLLDQVIAWSDARLEAEGVARVLGVASRQVLHDIAGALATSDGERCLAILQGLVEEGYDMGHVARDLLALLRDVVVARACQNPAQHLDLPDEEQRDVVALAGRTELDDLLRLHQGFSQGYDDVVRSGQPRAALEMLLLRLSRRPPLWPIDDLLARLGALERRLGGDASRPSGGTPSAAREPGGGGVSGRGAPRSAGASPPDLARSEASRAEPCSAGALASEEPSRPEGPEPLSAPGEVRPLVARQQLGPPKRAVPLPPEPSAPEPSAPEPSAPEPSAPEPSAPEPSAPEPSAPEPSAPAARARGNATRATRPVNGSSSPPPASGRKDLPGGAGLGAAVSGDDLLDRWRRVVDRVRARRPDIAAVYDHAVPSAVNGSVIELGFAEGDVLAEQASDRTCLAELKRAAEAELGQTPELKIGRVQAVQGEKATLAAIDAQAREMQRREAVARVRNHPRVTELIELFGARIKEVRLPTTE